ncbi:MAG TPA: hypothetical protein VJ825_03015 [Gemmatimonadaceae bacterium]|nr:hypothetical protein [Gemmatimonadaceae bacterium]
MGAPGIAAVMRRREREVVDDFRAAGATSPERAQPYTALGFGESLALRRLHNRAVIREAAPGMFYLDEEVWATVRRTRRRIATVLILMMLIVLAGILFGIVKT